MLARGVSACVRKISPGASSLLLSGGRATQSSAPPLPHAHRTYNYWANQKLTRYDNTETKAWKEQFANLGKYTDDELTAWRNAFDQFDPDHDGYISQADLQKFPTFTVEKAHLIKDYDRDRNNLIDFGEFVDAMFAVDVQSLKLDFSGFDSVDIQLEFDKYAVQDLDSGGRKHISLDGVKSLMNEKEFTVVTDSDAHQLMANMDVSKDGVIDIDDFKNWITAKA
ncbi:unnamed protein product [Vitrella brassicaformis CCMP3155]|uniref:EF-hand domain-containing protein n=2 Tax=Vitrella brassicaformis TaxID=1169539 RepID=A0A0G4EX88_VITBC|nr:unnamed protein product [Vitrella brassicaformis CCMP3155]|mmetsp:Transcript_39263/g.98221  ORF Transcript_39263/g.98221 Transcript_39263/m.98221 type:complete len:224 (+) Transcript_39263:66-737(+)|eukprot:CEM03617.1 unnamed protein product [Vitrella brassicaformis CCMP3155]